MIRIALFVIGSAAIAWISRRSMRVPRSHGFPRFFAFEAVLGLAVLNAAHWFENPVAPRQLISWTFLCASTVLVIWGLALLRRLGGLGPGDGVSATFGWENTGRLVTSGIYRFVRHPMYSSVLFLAWGVAFKNLTAVTILLGIVATGALVMTARAEEVENVRSFGDGYRDYMKQTWRFVPFLY